MSSGSLHDLVGSEVYVPWDDGGGMAMEDVYVVQTIDNQDFETLANYWSLPVVHVADLGGNGLYAFDTSASASTVESWLETYSDDIASLSPNWIEYATSVPTPNANQWYLNNVGQTLTGGFGGTATGTVGVDVQASAAWATTIGSEDIVVAVLDTGIEFGHNAFQGRIDQDNDRNYIPGGDFNTATDDNGHGTAVAGAIAAGGAVNNVWGISPHITILPIKIGNAAGGVSVAARVAAIQYVTDLKNNGLNIVAINNSSGGIRQFNDAEYQAIANAGTAGILFVAAAGNNTNDNDVGSGGNFVFPASYGYAGAVGAHAPLANVISVAATTNLDGLAGFSNFGGDSVHVAAPGRDMLLPYLNGTTEYIDGTSFAAPVVSGIIALEASLSPSSTSTQRRAALMAGVDVLPALNGLVTTSGRVNAAKTLAAIANWGFETNTLTAWTYSSADTTSYSLAHSGTYTARVSNGGNITQVIHGLRENTRYRVSAYGMLEAGSGTLTLAVNGVDLTATYSSALYDYQSVTFTTNTGVDTATLTLSSAAGSGHYAYFDDIRVAEDDLLTATGNVTISVGTTTISVTDGTTTRTLISPLRNPLTIDAGSTGRTVTVSGNVSLLDGLFITGSGANTLTVNSTRILQLGAYSSLPAISGSGSLTTLSGATVKTASAVSVSAITNNGSIYLNPSTAVTVSSVISGSGTMRVDGTGTVSLSAANTFTGLTTVYNGKLRYTVNNALDGGLITIDGASAVLDLNGHSDTVGTVTLNSGSIISGTLTTTGSFDMRSGTVTSILAGSGKILTKSTSGTVVLSAASTYSGVTNLFDGTLRYTVNNALDGGGITLWNPTSVLDLNGHSDTIGTVTLYAGTITGGTLGTTASFDLMSGAVSAILAGSSRVLNKSTTGTVVLSGANTFTGGANLNGGVLSLAHSGALDTTGTIAFGGGVLQFTSANTTDYSARFSNAAGQNYALDTNSQTVTWATARSSSGGTLAKLGTGTLNLSAANTFTGLTSVLGGTLRYTVNNALDGGGVTVSGTSSVLDLNGRSDTVGTITLDGGTITSGTLTTTADAYELKQGVVSSILAGTNKYINKTTSGTVSLSGANTFTGGAKLVGGVLSLASSGALDTTGTINFSGGILQFTGSNTTDYSARFVTAAGQAYAIDTNGQSVSLATALASSGGSLAKSGTGTLTLSAAYSSGAVTVSQGLLVLAANASMPSLAGAGSLTINSTRVLTLTGNSSVTTVTNNGSLVFNTSGTMAVSSDISGSGGITKSGTGTATLSGAYTGVGAVSVSAGKLAFATTAANRQSAGVLLKFASLSINSYGILDVTNHDLMIGGANAEWINEWILAGYEVAAPGGELSASSRRIVSSATLAEGTPILVPFIADIVLGDGSPNSSLSEEWDGVAITESDTIIIKYTYFGDANLDGQVDEDDETVITNNLNTASPGLADFGAAFMMGDMNFSGRVDGGDYFLVNGAPQNILLTVEGSDAVSAGIAGTMELSWGNLDLWEGLWPGGTSGGAWVYGSPEALGIELWDGISLTFNSDEFEMDAFGHFDNVGFTLNAVDIICSGQLLSFQWNGVTLVNADGLGVGTPL